MGLLSHGQLSFDPLKPIILRGLPTDDGSTLFAGNVVLNLTRPTKVSKITVSLRSQVVTYWPEGIGTRGTRLTHEKSLGEQRLEILGGEMIVLQAGEHRFGFGFVIPNSTVTSIEDTFGRVKHVIEAQVQRPGIVILSHWIVSKPIMILRTYMSNSLLTNNSLATLSKTFEKHEWWGDIEVVVEAAAFSPGEIFYVRVIIEPRMKHTRIEHIELNCVESRKYSVPEMQAWRTDNQVFRLPFAGSFRLAEYGQVSDTTEELRPAFEKNGKGIELEHDFAHRIAFSTPSCAQGIRNTTYIKEILMKHHLELNITLSHQGKHMEGTLTPPPQAHHPDRLIPAPLSFKLNKTKEKQESIKFDTAITIFDCRLKEDYGRLPSYFELGVKPTEMNGFKKKSRLNQNVSESNQPRPYFCPCYFGFCQQVELASQSLFSPNISHSTPPPDYSTLDIPPRVTQEEMK